jgi:predicted GNAT superfamily acetyltransferase
MLATNKESAKSILRKHEWVEGDRRIGKTEALIEVIHEDHQGNAVVVYPSAELGEMFKRRYHEKYPHDPIPSVQNARNAGRGETRPIYADVYWRFTDQDCSYLDRVVTAAIW